VRIVHSPFGLHSPGHSAEQPAQGRISRRSRPSLPARRIRHLGDIRRGRPVQSSAFASGSPIRNWSTGPIRTICLHDGARRLFPISSGRSSGAFAYTLLQTSCSPLTQYWRFVLGAILALIVVGFPAGLPELPTLAAAVSREQRGDGAGGKPEWSARPMVHSSRSIQVSCGGAEGELVSIVGPNGAGKDDAGQPAHRIDAADLRRRLFMGHEHCRDRPGPRWPIAAWRAPSSSSDLSQADRSETIAAAVVSAAEKALAAVLAACGRRRVNAASPRSPSSSGCVTGSTSSRRRFRKAKKKLLDVASAFALDPLYPAGRTDLGRFHRRQARHHEDPDRGGGSRRR